MGIEPISSAGQADCDPVASASIFSAAGENRTHSNGVTTRRLTLRLRSPSRTDRPSGLEPLTSRLSGERSPTELRADTYPLRNRTEHGPLNRRLLSPEQLRVQMAVKRVRIELTVPQRAPALQAGGPPSATSSSSCTAGGIRTLSAGFWRPVPLPVGLPPYLTEADGRPGEVLTSGNRSGDGAEEPERFLALVGAAVEARHPMNL